MSNEQEVAGQLAEQEFIKRLNILGIPYEYLDDWVDFKIYGTPVDVKSCRLSIKKTDKQRTTQAYTCGRFDLTDTQREKNIWLALFVRSNDEFIFLGLTRNGNNSKRYISIHKTRDLQMYSIKEFSKLAKSSNKHRG